MSRWIRALRSRSLRRVEAPQPARAAATANASALQRVRLRPKTCARLNESDLRNARRSGVSLRMLMHCATAGLCAVVGSEERRPLRQLACYSSRQGFSRTHGMSLQSQATTIGK